MKDETKTSIAYILARIGNIKKSREMLEYLISRSHTHYVSSFKIALIYMALDENDETFVWLEKAYHERCNELPQLLKTAPILDELRPDPRFQDLLKRMKQFICWMLSVQCCWLMIYLEYPHVRIWIKDKRPALPRLLCRRKKAPGFRHCLQEIISEIVIPENSVGWGRRRFMIHLE